MSEAPATFATVTLRTKVLRGETRIEKIALREPDGTALMGISLFDLMQMGASEIIRLLPRISEPPLTVDEARSLGGHDLLDIGQEISSFLLLSESD